MRNTCYPPGDPQEEGRVPVPGLGALLPEQGGEAGGRGLPALGRRRVAGAEHDHRHRHLPLRGRIIKHILSEKYLEWSKCQSIPPSMCPLSHVNVVI